MNNIHEIFIGVQLAFISYSFNQQVQNPYGMNKIITKDRMNIEL